MQELAVAGQVGGGNGIFLSNISIRIPGKGAAQLPLFVEIHTHLSRDGGLFRVAMIVNQSHLSVFEVKTLADEKLELLLATVRLKNGAADAEGNLFVVADAITSAKAAVSKQLVVARG